MLTAAQAFHAAQPGDEVIGWKLERGERDALLSRFPPRYAQAVADHVTLRSRVLGGSTLPPESVGVIVGRSDDGAGVEAMVVRIDGSTERPDGRTYHVTWSLAPGRQAVESNQVIASRGWQPLAAPVPVRLKPATFPRS
jgi:hypothetical protein